MNRSLLGTMGRKGILGRGSCLFRGCKGQRRTQRTQERFGCVVVGEHLDMPGSQSLEILNARSRNLDFNFSKSYVFEMNLTVFKEFSHTLKKKSL